MTWTRKKALKDVSILTISQYTVQFITALRGFLFAKYLGPEGFGVWASIYLFYTYGQYCHFGVFNGAAILVPEKIGAGKEEEANKLLSSAITWMNVFGLLFFIFIAIYISFNKSPFISTYWLPILIVSFAVPIYQNYIFSIYRLQFQHNFKKSGIYQALFAISDVTISFILLLQFGIAGAFIGMLISLLIITLFIVKNGYKGLFIYFDKFYFKTVLKYGFQLLIISFTFVFLTTADKYSLASFFSKSDMGYYSIALSIAMLPYTISLALQGVITQRMLEEYGKTNDINSIKLFLDESILAIALITPILFILINTFAEPLISLFLPKYTSSTTLIYKLSIGIYFLSISIVCYSFLVVIKKNIHIIVSNFILIILAIFSNYMISKHQLGFTLVVVITIATYLLYFSLLYFFSYKNYYNKQKNIFTILKIIFISSVIIIAFLPKYFISNNFLQFFLPLFLNLVWSIFVIYYLKKKTLILRQIMGILKSKLIFFYTNNNF